MLFWGNLHTLELQDMHIISYFITNRVLRYNIKDVPGAKENNVLYACNHSYDLMRLIEQSLILLNAFTQIIWTVGCTQNIVFQHPGTSIMWHIDYIGFRAKYALSYWKAWEHILKSNPKIKSNMFYYDRFKSYKTHMSY